MILITSHAIFDLFKFKTKINDSLLAICYTHGHIHVQTTNLLTASYFRSLLSLSTAEISDPEWIVYWHASNASQS